MKYTDDIRKELEEISPLLSTKLPEKDGFKTPDGYFDTLQSRLEKRMATPQPEVEHIVRLESTKKTRSVVVLRFAAAASVAALVVLLAWVGRDYLHKPEKNLAEADTLEQLSAKDVLAYLDQNIDNYDLSTAVEANVVGYDDVDFHDVKKLSDEELNFYINNILLQDEEEFSDINL